ncbi:MAG: ABC transporter permease [Methylococcales bacterium]
MNNPGPRLKIWRVTGGLALKELWHDRKVTFCLVASLASVLAPLLLLFGLKSGIVANLEQRLLQDPKKREIVILGNYKLQKTWFDTLRTRSDVDFLIQLTRSLNTTVDLMKSPGEFLEGVEVVPTAEGDPLIPANLKVPEALGRILVSHSVALKLAVGAQDFVTLIVHRHREGTPETGRIRVKIDGVLPERAFGRDGIFAALELLIAAEDFRDARRVPVFGIDSGEPRTERAVFARARLYATSLDDVSPLADLVRRNGIEVKTYANEIEETKQIEEVLSFIFNVIAWVAVSGAASSLIGSMIANVDRKRHELSFLRLLGFPVVSIALYPAIQSLVIATLGFFLAGGAYTLGALAFNNILGSNLGESGFVCRLSGLHTAIAYILTNLIVLTAALIGGYRAAQIEPAESLRRT